jgi:hypothetical protein
VDELSQSIMQRTGLDEEQARAAAQAAIDFLRQRLPEPAKGMLDRLVGGRQSADAVRGFFLR